MRPKTSDNFLLHKLSVHDDGSKNTPNQNWNLTQPARGEALITRRVQFQRYTLVPLLSKVKDIWVAGFSAQLARLLSRSWFIPAPKTVFGSISSFSIFHPKEHGEQPPIDCDDQEEFLTCGQDMIGSCSPDSERYPLSAHRHTALTDNTSRTRGERMLRPGDIYLGLLSRQMRRQTPRKSAPAQLYPFPPERIPCKESGKQKVIKLY